MSVKAEALPPKISADVALHANLSPVCHPVAVWMLVLLLPSPIPPVLPPPFCRHKGGSVLTSYSLLTLVDVDSLSSRLGDIDAVIVSLQSEVDSDDTENKGPELPS